MANSQIKISNNSLIKSIQALGGKDLLLKRLDWLSVIPVQLPFFDYELTVFLSNGSRIIGRGTDQSNEIAVLKAIVECVERICVRRSFENSNGWAGHLNLRSAESNAKLELIERDLYLCHFLTKRPFMKIGIDHIAVPRWLKETADFLFEKYNVEICIGRMFGSDTLNAVAIAIFGGLYFGVITSQSCSVSLAAAIEKAAIESLRNAVHEISGDSGSRPLSLGEFSKLKNMGPRNHYLLGLHSSSVPLVRGLYSESKISIDDAIPDCFRTIVFFDKTPSTSIPFHIVKAECELMQKMFFGLPSVEKININRLIDFTNNSNLRYSDVNTHPHTHN